MHASDGPRRGDVHWLPADALTPHVPGVPHPHVVVQDDLFNASRIETVVVCALSTNMKRASEPGNVMIPAGEAGLPRDSIVVVSRIATAPKAALGEPIGRLSEPRIEQVLAGLAFVHRLMAR